MAPPTFDEFKLLTNRAEAGDESALAELKRFFKNDPHALTAFYGERFVRDTLEKMTFTNKTEIFCRESIVQQVEKLRDELCGKSTSPIIRLLAEAAAMAWLHYTGLERFRAITEAKALTIPLGHYFQRALTEAQKRYLRALRELDVASRRLKSGLEQ